jgi:competence protein ComEC
LKVDIIDVGQGTATLVRFTRGEAMIVDGGGFADQSFDIGRQVVAPFLWNQGVRTIDYMVLSHDHPDHRNGLRFLLNHFKVGSYWTSGVPDAGAGGGEPPATNLESIASARNVTVRSFPELSEDLAVGPALIRVLSPSEDSMRGGNSLATNDLSLVLEIRFGGTTVVLPGDIGSTIEKQITGKITKGSKSLLLSAHHGSRHSNSEEMLEALRPEAVVFSCGFGNTFGFPATNVLARCDARGIRTYRTDTDGAVSAVSDGQDWKIFTQAARSGRR